MIPPFEGAGLLIGPLDFAISADALGCDVEALHAVVNVETAGHGFDQSKRPSMLFEPAVFYRRLEEKGAACLPAAVSAGVACQSWAQVSYPADSYGRLTIALGLDRDEALKSASWGLGQIMGFNYALAGFSDVVGMIEAAKQSEGRQLAMMVAFLRAQHLDRLLRARDWVGFALAYNGRAEAAHDYHERLAAAYAQLQRGGARSAPPAPPRVIPAAPVSADDLNGAELQRLAEDP